MSQERTEAIVMRGVDFSETSRIVTLLCPERGRMACMARGARRPKSALAGMLDTFNRLEVVYYWKDGRQVQNLGDVTLMDGFRALKQDLDKTLYAAFPLELAYKVAHENEPSQELYGTLVQGLEHLSAWEGDIRDHTAWQVTRLLAVAGFGLDELPDSYGGRAAGFTRVERDVLARLTASPEQCPGDAGAPSLISALYRFACDHVETEFRSYRVLRQTLL